MLKLDLPGFSHKERMILTDIFLHLEEGSDLTVMGPNGAGKSTLARILCGLIPVKKSVCIDGEYLEDIPLARRKKIINYIPSRLEIYDDFLKAEAYLKLCGEGCDRQEVLRTFGLETLAMQPLSSLSSGEQQMLMLACAKVHAAKYTIYDEPTANLDPPRVRKIFTFLQETTGHKIVITHDLHLAQRLGFPIFYLHEGRGRFYSEANLFFSEVNLRKLFGESLIKKGEIVVVNL